LALWRITQIVRDESNAVEVEADHADEALIEVLQDGMLLIDHGDVLRIELVEE